MTDHIEDQLLEILRQEEVPLDAVLDVRRNVLARLDRPHFDWRWLLLPVAASLLLLAVPTRFDEVPAPPLPRAHRYVEPVPWSLPTPRTVSKPASTRFEFRILAQQQLPDGRLQLKIAGAAPDVTVLLESTPTNNEDNQ